MLLLGLWMVICKRLIITALIELFNLYTIRLELPRELTAKGAAVRDIRQLRGISIRPGSSGLIGGLDMAVLADAEADRILQGPQTATVAATPTATAT